MAHASIGPSCALAEFKNGKMTVWTHSQGVFPLRDHLSLGFIFKRSVISHEKPIGLPRSTAPDKNIRVFVARDFEHFLTVILSIVLPNCDPDCLKLY
jgi:hypothetical protein